MNLEEAEDYDLIAVRDTVSVVQEASLKYEGEIFDIEYVGVDEGSFGAEDDALYQTVESELSDDQPTRVPMSKADDPGYVAENYIQDNFDLDHAAEGEKDQLASL